jgi:hypothetical protein
VKLIGWFQIAVGVAMLGLWSVLVLSGEVPELRAGQLDIVFHIAAEVLTALLLIVAGTALLRTVSPRVRMWSTFALGALLYTAVNSAGYYAELGDWPPVGLFLVLAVGTVAATGRVILGAPDTPADDAPARQPRVPAGDRP